MGAGMVVFCSLSIGFIIAGIVLAISAKTGRMILIEQLKEDWIYCLPFRLRNNRYRGLSRPSYQLLVFLYYTAKSIVILTFCVYYYMLSGTLIVVKWIWTAILSLSNKKQRTEKRQPAILNENAISTLWNHGSETAWKEALDYYYKALKDDEQALEQYMENVDADEIAQLSDREFYDFLYNKYFVWKYTAKNRLATTRKSLARYIDKNRLFELSDIQKRLFSTERSNVEKCLRIASEIRGLGPAGASGFLSILFPESFGTVDQYVVKALREVKGLAYNAEIVRMNPDSLSIKDGALLIQILQEKAVSLNKKFDTDFWTPRKIDMVLWAVGRVRK